jgi:hypothetical protein
MVRRVRPFGVHDFISARQCGESRVESIPCGLFDLPHALSRHAQHPTDFLERPLVGDLVQQTGRRWPLRVEPRINGRVRRVLELLRRVTAIDPDRVTTGALRQIQRDRSP